MEAMAMAMPTDAERREVARRLREYVDLPDDWWQETRAEFYVEKCVFGNVDRHSEAELFTRLADLIEPSDRNDELCVHCDYCDYCDLPKCSDQDGYSFKPKGYVDLLVLADKISETSRQDMEMCGDTVPAWYAAARLEAVARSIRAASARRWG